MILFVLLRGSVEEPAKILKKYPEEFLMGDELDISQIDETIDGETFTTFCWTALLAG